MASKLLRLRSVRPFVSSSLPVLLGSLLAIAGCGASHHSGVVPGKTVTSVAVSPSSVTVKVGDTQQFTATATYSDGSTADVTTTAAWGVSNNAIASTNGTGLVKGVAAGSTTVVAQLNNVTGSASLNVTAVAPTIASITIKPANLSVTAGATQQYQAVATYSDGTSGDVTSKTTWASSSTAVATISASGVATAVAAGTTTITGTDGAVSATTTLTITTSTPAPATLSSIAVTPATASVNIGATQQFTATGSYSDGTTKNITASVSWSSSNATIATVNAAGLATGVAAGSVSVTATLSGVSGKASLTVSSTTPPPPTLSSIAVTPASASIKAGATQQFTATGTYSDGTTKNITASVTWSSSSAAVATINSAGLATGVAAGSATISATLSGVSGKASLTVGSASATVSSIAVSPATASFAASSTQQFKATATYSDGTTADVSSSVTWSSSDISVATINASGLATGVASGSSTITAALSSVSGKASVTITAKTNVTTVNIPTWHVDSNRSGLNAQETALTPSTVNASSFGKLWSYLVDGYVYGEPLVMSNLTIGGAKHNVMFVATEADSVYAFNIDSNSQTPLWKTSLLQSGETPLTNGAIQPYQGVTSTPVIDTGTNTIYVVSAQKGSNGGTFRLNALDITTGAQKPGSPVTINASVPGTNPSGNGSTVTLTTGCIQRAALLLANGNVYIGVGDCPTGWLLAYNASTLAQVAVWNASPNLAGVGTYASAGGVWMGGGGPVADSSGNIYITTGNGPWNGSDAWGDSVIKFSPTLQIVDYFTPQDYAFMNCDDADLAGGGLLLIPGTSQLVAGGKTGKMYVVNSSSMGHEQANDAGATQTLWFESDLSAPYSQSCPAGTGSYSGQVNSYQIFGSSAWYNGSVYLGISPTGSNVVAPVRQFQWNGSKLTPGAYSAPSVGTEHMGTTPFISSNGNSSGIVWMINQGVPLQKGTPTNATLYAYDATNFPNQLYSSGANPGDTPGYGIKFTSPVVANGKVFISTGHDPVSATNPQGEIDVYGLK